MTRPPIRALTIGVAEPHPVPAAALDGAVSRAQRARVAFQAEGYEVQTIRISTRPLLDDLADWSAARILDYALALDDALAAADGDLIASIGCAPAHRPSFDLERLEVLADVLVRARLLYGTAQLATVTDGVRHDAALPAARIALRLAHETGEGLGPFRFAAIACIEPGCPFFPAGYHNGASSLSIGWQGAGIMAAASAGEGRTLNDRLREALIASGTPIVELGTRVAEELELRFGGLDVSPAPAGDDSIGQAIESCGDLPVGAPGTFAVVGAMTNALRTTGLPTCGYSGLMLPIMEDSVLARRWADGGLVIHQLLAYSAICGTGLDAVPLAGDVTEDEIAALYLDVATLAVRLGKPLSARLMPIPGRRRGELTNFSSPYLVNTRI
jgi:uncharacterized protein (UPF0210 family)